ncbi:MAG: aminotransferase class IV family protein [Bacteroidetes bacterium]|nr:aminotransferase class IV family protein [Bacteroidota bacterium]
MIGYTQNQYLNVSNITLPITATTINRSYAAFEYFTLVNGKPFYVDRHINRLFNTLKILRINIKYSYTDIFNIINNLLVKNLNPNFSYKLFVIPEPSKNYQQFESELYIIPVNTPIIANKNSEHGNKLIVKNYQRFLPEAKTTNYIAHIYLEYEVITQNAIDVLYINRNRVRETSRSNIFMVKNDVIYTPKSKVLQGITKSIVIDLIKKHKIDFIEHDFTFDDLLKSDEVFISSTTREITAISQIGTSMISDGKIGMITKKLQHQFKNLKKGY